MAILSMLNARQPAHTAHTARQRASRSGQRTVSPPAPQKAPTKAPEVGQPRAGGGGGVLNWSALRACESGGNYANRRNPTYRGGYQFSRSTWASVGGVGDPADAPPDEQDQRAASLYQRSGRTPWPTCGHRL